MALDKNRLKVFINEIEIAERVQELAEQINEDYSGKKVVLLTVLSGSLIFVADLIRYLQVDHELRYVKIRSYQGTESTGKFDFQSDLSGDLSGKDVLIIEDIVDTGNTLDFLIAHIGKKKPKSIKTATLLWKPKVYDFHHKIEYVGFSIPDHFVVGYGMDIDEEGRNLKDIFTYIN